MRRQLALIAWVTACWGADCSHTSTNFNPLNAPFFLAYRGMRGGLYQDGANKRPASHEAAGLRLAAQVRPRDAAGAVNDQTGKIVFLSIGMSNTTQQFPAFQQFANRN